MDGPGGAGVEHAGACSDFEHFRLGYPAQEYNLYVHPTDRFKTTTLRLYLHTALCEEEAARTALVPALLRRGCRRYPSLRAMTRALDDLYGAQLDADVLKIGERQLVFLSLDLAGDRYVGGEDLLPQGLGFLQCLLREPLGDDGSFPDELVAQEAAHLVHAVASLADDKLHYAIERCFRLMCDGEPFGVYEYGTVEALRAVTGPGLRLHLDQLLEASPADLFVVGDVDPHVTARLVASQLTLPRGEIRHLPPIEAQPTRRAVQRVVESLPGDAALQGELILGYRSRIRMRDPLAPALLLLDDLMGGGPSSRLFRLLREEQQLMYSISSFLVKSKGLWMVVASVADDAREVVEATVTRELERIAAGQLEDEELDTARRQVLSQLRTVDDAPGRKISFLLGRLINDRVATPLQVEAELQDVTRSQVIRAAGSLQLDTVYFLAPETPGEVEA
jgi:predicted Zn-dependent peptidase